MQATTIVLLALFLSASTATAAPASAPSDPYPAMAPLAQYLMPEADEIVLARSAAPRAVSDEADVMVLRKEGYVTAVK